MPTPPLPVIKAATWISRRLHQLADAPLPPEIALFELANASNVSAVIKAMCDLRVGDALARSPYSTADLAAELDAHEDSLLRLLRVAESLDLVKRRGGRWQLTRRGRGLRTDVDFTIVPWATYAANPVVQAAWNGMASGIRAGQPAFPLVNGQSTWAWFDENPEAATTFNQTMRALCDFTGPELAALGDWPAGAVICDVAGGVGTLLVHLLATDATLTGVLFDQPSVIAGAPTFLAERHVTDRVTTTSGSFFEPLEVSADVFVLKDILHDWGNEPAVQILGNVVASMRPGNRLAIAEIIQDPERANSLAPFVDLTMMTQTDGGRQRSIEEFDALFSQVGLRRTAVREGALYSLVEAELG